MALARSLSFSLLASILATAVTRRILSVAQPPEDTHQGKLRGSPQTLVVVVPILVGNSNNRIGWIKETHHHHRSLLGRVFSDA